MSTPRSAHEHALSTAFDGQAAQFERAPVQTDPAALARLVRFADLPSLSHVLDAGCGPGLVSRAFLEAGFEVVGVDLSAEMIGRARTRCVKFGERARFEQRSLFDGEFTELFDATISRYVLHHVPDPLAFVRRQVDLLRPGGVLVLSDHSTDTDGDLARHHQDLEIARDHTHTRNLTPGAVADLLIAGGLNHVRLEEEAFELDFDEWFDRGTPGAAKAEVRQRLLDGQSARGFRPTLRDDGSIRLDCWRTLARGVKPMTLEALLVEYTNTTYRIKPAVGRIDLRIGQANASLDLLLQEHGVRDWAFLTAFNPGSQQRWDAENDLAHERLLEALAPYTVLEGVGLGDSGRWPAERSLFVLGLDREQTRLLGRSFGQVAVVVGTLGGVAELVRC